MSSGLRKHLKQLPFFLLYNYPKKLKTYYTIKEKNKTIENKEDKKKLNAYHSPSPMNELCDYICTWENRNILWDNQFKDLADTRVLIINNDLDLTDKKILKFVRTQMTDYAKEIKDFMRKHQDQEEDEQSRFIMQQIVNKYKTKLSEELKLDEELIANYVIKASYSSLSTKKSFVWAAYADYIIKNLKNNSNPNRNVSIEESPYKTSNTKEYLGKHYVMEYKEADKK